VCIGTGPSLTPAQIESARRKGFTLFGCNKVHEIVPDLALCFGFKEFWNYYAPIRHRCAKWTIDEECASRFGLNWIHWKDAAHLGLSTGPAHIHHGKSAGFALLNLAYLAGAERIVLLGYDMKFAPDYDGRARLIGSTPRHFFGEYPEALQHWPSVRVRAGVHEELIGFYEAVSRQSLVEIVNCSPDSALACFPSVDIERLS
jgi:hypothetical protein